MDAEVRASKRPGRGVNAMRERERERVAGAGARPPASGAHVRQGRTVLPDEPFILMIGDGTGPDAYSVFLHRTKREHRYRSLENARMARDEDTSYREVYRRRKGTAPRGPWTTDEELALTRSVALQLAQKTPIDFAIVAEAVRTRTKRQCRARWSQLDWNARGVRKDRRRLPKRRKSAPKRSPGPRPEPIDLAELDDLGAFAELFADDFTALPSAEGDNRTATTTTTDEDQNDDDPPTSPLPMATIVPSLLVQTLGPERAETVRRGGRWQRTLFGDNQLGQSLLRRQPSFSFPRPKRPRAASSSPRSVATGSAGAAAPSAPAFLESTQPAILASPESACA